MPRRNERRETPPPLNLAPAPVSHQFRSAAQIKAAAERRERQRRERAEAERKARMVKAIDWSTCCVAGCDESLLLFGKVMAGDPEQELPLCYRHEVMAWRQVQRRNRDPEIIKTTETLAAEEDERERQATARRMACTQGDIYFVRLNGLVKVGWSRDVHTRLRAYGPDVTVLCTYPASRDDETNLHRQLRPFLARGREWYEDCQLIEDMVEDIVDRHGEPAVYDEWTRPKPAAIGVRRSARAKPTGLSP